MLGIQQMIVSAVIKASPEAATWLGLRTDNFGLVWQKNNTHGALEPPIHHDGRMDARS